MKEAKDSRELFLGVFKGEEYTEIPIWFMRQAGRHLPEYMKIREKKNFEERAQTPEIAAEITLQPVRRYNIDAAIIFSDILIPLYGMERGLEIVPGVGPVIEKPIVSPDEIAELKKTSSKEDFPYIEESIKLVRKEIRNKALIGFAGAPFTLASYLIEGKSTRDALTTKAFAFNHPSEFKQLLQLLTEIVIDQLASQVKAGADAIQVFDSWAGFLSPAQYQEWGLPFVKQIFDNFEEVPSIFYARGSNHLLPITTEIGAKGYSIDTTLSLTKAKEILGNKVLQGNLDPAYLLTSPEVVERASLKILEEAATIGRSSYIFNLGTGVNKDSSIENVVRMVETVKKFKRDEK
ncbi:MAG: uroporphyrinogen decarboxylase [Candidatus Heimdallarchaeota archaeon]|nr:uroporphyrinogen decarboxylase [Candidatus Heimdallarchaeota archaeon]MCK5048782.1 uroporphyrinogen decarboxylase [Candidatus Heimdallarchaeota archaeon]